MQVITKQELNSVIAAAAKAAVFYAPLRREFGVEYTATTGNDDICYEYVNVKRSPKGLFFPQKEVLCTFCHGMLREVPLPESPFILFGLRPCDARALAEIELVFDDQAGRFQDPYYLARKNNALLITLACNEPADTCFCATTGGSPTDATGSDIVVTELDGELLFDVCSEKGQEFMQTYKTFFHPSTETHLAAKDKKARNAAEMLQTFDIGDMNAMKKRLDGMFEESVWQTITNNCLGCGACTYLCPTCHCFDISDETNNRGEGVRLRVWDSCQYPLFTKHASGHNPRVSKKQRMRQRIMHKFSYTVEKNAAIFCVGCGRCVLHCPVNLDIREMLTTLNNM